MKYHDGPEENFCTPKSNIETGDMVYLLDIINTEMTIILENKNSRYFLFHVFFNN